MVQATTEHVDCPIGHPGAEVMVERATSAIAKELYGDEETWRAAARSAMASMREPSEALLQHLDLANSGWGIRRQSLELWQELIDIALNAPLRS